MTRRKLTSLINDMGVGKDPLNVSYDENADAWKTVAYAYLKPRHKVFLAWDHEDV